MRAREPDTPPRNRASSPPAPDEPTQGADHEKDFRRHLKSGCCRERLFQGAPHREAPMRRRQHDSMIPQQYGCLTRHLGGSYRLLGMNNRDLAQNDGSL